MVFESASQNVILCAIEDFDLCLSATAPLEVFKEIIFHGDVCLQFFQKLLSHPQPSFFNSLVFLNLSVLSEEGIALNSLTLLLFLNLFLIDVLPKVIAVYLLIEVFRSLPLVLLSHSLRCGRTNLGSVGLRFSRTTRGLIKLFRDVLGHLGLG